uniref:phosphatidate cytidylyltransferase n=1 Tax=Pararhizobium sp. IMCC3301 TaxID=3067904 RepID=UPI0027418A43|nr:phosphatidate cytidylyltransferase [Pararhizobium sp. IMCC3301]
MQPLQPESAGFLKSNLFVRICSALVFAPLVLIAGWLGGWPFLVLVLVVSGAVSFEWLRIIIPAATPLAIILMLGLVFASLYLIAFNPLQTAFWPVFLLFGGIVVAGYALGLKLWLGAGFAYAVLLGAALLMIRNDPSLGMTALGFIVAIVWATDIFAYLVGRTLKGPKLWPAISPGKTWSGAFGGLCAAIAASAAFYGLIDAVSLTRLILTGLVLSVASQCGDLFESWIKRRFKVKDSSHLIPGHGGVMDRVDGLVFALIAALLLVWLTSGNLDQPARTLLLGSA